jgi:peptidoglycan hydrolase-like protein with peptidoglycan-binding domain
VSGPHETRRRRRLRWVVVGVSVLVVLGIGTAVAVTRIGARPAATGRAPAAPDTVAVRKVDLAERETVSGDLGYGPPTTLTGRRPGTVTALPAPGTVLDRGAVAYQVDARPVVVFLGALPLYRVVGPGTTDGPDVRLVEENLRDLGFRGFGTPDEEFTSGTATAIGKWQKKLRVERTGAIELGQVVVVPAPVRVSAVTAALGGEATGAVLDYTGTTRSVTATLDAGQKDLAPVGTKVTLVVDGKPVPGTVTAVVPAVTDEQDPQADDSPAFTATVSVDDLAAIGAVDAGPVDVEITAGAREGVLAVPVGALLALAEGGYALERASGELVPVTTGLFADGLVEVSGEGLSEGVKVVTTS